MRSLALSVVAMFLMAGAAAAQALPPFKDRLFALPATLETSDGGSRVVVDYREIRDINGRDEIPERRAHAAYVDLGVRRAQAELVADVPAGAVRHVAVGQREGAHLIVVYVHGQGGSRHQGVDDFTFGGNFNRIKNLVLAAGGLYLSPDVADFEENGAQQIGALLEIYAAGSPQADIYLACGSAGGGICWRLARDADIVPRLGGLLLLGSHWDDGFTGSPAFKSRVPVYLGHGSRDSVFPVDRQEAFLRAVRAADPTYPIRFVRFESGSHGTPIRMTDWRVTINWMAGQ